MSSIVSFVEKYISVSAEDRKLLEEGQTLKRFQKKQEILVGPELHNFGLFLVEGICYLEKIDPSGHLKVIDFYFQGEPILVALEPGSEIEGYSLRALKDCAVMLSDARRTEFNMSQYPKFERVCRLFAEEQLRKSQKIGELLKLQDPAEKLNALMLWRPEIIRNVPKHLIANFLGMRSETLSRVNSRFSENLSEN
jgi:CRP-like cAMP-binding protein